MVVYLDESMDIKWKILNPDYLSFCTMYFFPLQKYPFNKLFLDFRLLSSSFHIQSFLIGVEYRNYFQTFDVYSKKNSKK